MYKSSIGTFISNLLMIQIVLLNNEGPGWEVSMSTMLTLSKVSDLLSMSFIFTFITLLIGLRKLKFRTFKFKISILLNLLLSIAFLIFLFRVDGFRGQFWFRNFPQQIFTLISVGINLLLFITVSYLRFQKNNKTLSNPIYKEV